MRVLQVIHGYPTRYNAGSEIYTQAVAQGLLRAGHEVAVFTREEDPFRPDYVLRRERDPEDPRIPLYLVNMPRSRDRYRHEEVDRQFERVAEGFEPGVVHIGHLNHLSTSIVQRAHDLGLPIVFTLHDYWLMCPRGQFIQYRLGGPEPWPLCDGQDDRKCATECYSRYYTGDPDLEEEDIRHWEAWVHARMTHVRAMAGLVDLFIAPSRTLYREFSEGFGIPETRLVYLDYGFDLPRLGGRRRKPEPEFVFGYIGTHQPAKGIHVLLEAFPHVKDAARLRIFGRALPQSTAALRERSSFLAPRHAARVEWMGEFGGRTIVQEVFDRVDALVVPSIWLENSPLVIHEAQQARVPVIASDLGGMAEYIHHEINGLLFTPRDPEDLARQMQRFVDDPELARRLGARGYLYSRNGDVPSIEEHVEALVSLYERVMLRKVTA